MSYVAWSHLCATPAAVPSCTGFYGLLSKSSVLATLCVHMHLLLQEETSYHAFKIFRTCNSLRSLARPFTGRNFFPCFRVLRNVPPPRHSGFPACMSNLSYNVLAAVWCVCNTWASFQTCQNSARPQKKNTLYDCNTHTTAMQKNALHVSVSFQPRALARKPGPTERPGSGLSWLRLAPGHGRTTAPLGRGAAIGIEHG